MQQQKHTHTHTHFENELIGNAKRQKKISNYRNKDHLDLNSNFLFLVCVKHRKHSTLSIDLNFIYIIFGLVNCVNLVTFMIANAIRIYSDLTKEIKTTRITTHVAWRDWWRCWWWLSYKFYSRHWLLVIMIFDIICFLHTNINKICI